MRIAALQMNSSDELAANQAVAAELVAKAAEAGAQLAVLPENFGAVSADDTLRVAIAESDGDGPLQECLGEIARRNRIWLVGGTIPIRSDDAQRPHASCCVYDSLGRRVGRYDKMHLFDVGIPGSEESYRESAHTMPGDTPLLLETPWGRLGIAVCYDLRFPELFRHLCSLGMELLALPAAFTEPTGRAHWQPLLQARAIENLCYVAAAAQTGVHPGGRRTYGHSMIVDPWGKILGNGGEEFPVAVMGTADLGRLRRIRQDFPALAHRRLADDGSHPPTEDADV